MFEVIKDHFKLRKKAKKRKEVHKVYVSKANKFLEGDASEWEHTLKRYLDNTFERGLKIKNLYEAKFEYVMENIRDYSYNKYKEAKENLQLSCERLDFMILKIKNMSVKAERNDVEKLIDDKVQEIGNSTDVSRISRIGMGNDLQVEFLEEDI